MHSLYSRNSRNTLQAQRAQYGAREHRKQKVKKGRKKEQPVKSIRKTLIRIWGLQFQHLKKRQIMRSADSTCSFVRRPATASYKPYLSLLQLTAK